MGTRYAAYFQIEPGEVRGPALLERVAEDCTVWLRVNAGQPPDGEYVGAWQLEDRQGGPPNSGSVVVHREHDGDDAVYSFAWTHRRDDATWTAELQLATVGEQVDLSGSVRTVQSGAGEGFDSRIAIVAELIDRYDCRRGGLRLRTSSRLLAATRIDAFVEDCLLDPRRELPLVVVSAGRDQQPSLDPDKLQRRLAGVATVWSLDRQGSDLLSRSLGHSLSCYNGAVRVYRPGFRRADPHRRHPFWLGPALRSTHAPTNIAVQAGPMGVSSAGVTAFQDVQERIRVRERERLAATARESGDQIAALRQQLEHERRWREEALKERERYQSLYEQTQRDLDQQHSAQAEVESDEAVVVESVLEAVQIADKRRSECLSFLNDAFDSAEQSDFRQPERVLNALSALNTLSQELNNGSVALDQIVQALNDRNIECSTESTDTMHRYGDLRRFRDETGQLIEMPLHVKLGGGAGQDNHLRIHFAWSSDYAQILVGHVGRHLRTARS